MIRTEVLDGNCEIPEIFVVKRNGERVPFDLEKVEKAIKGANSDEPIEAYHIADDDIRKIAEGIESKAMSVGRDLGVEEIQDLVEDSLMMSGKTHVARRYITYRYTHNKDRRLTEIDEKIKGIISRTDEDVKTENSNKNPTILSTQRDYMAGEWSRYYIMNHVLPREIADAHKKGIIHFHDSDYAAMQMTNCCLINLEDMLQNGTVISGTMIEKPHRFITACTVASQISAAVASSQYGGQTISLAHLAPFVNETRKSFTNKFREELPYLTEEQLADLVEKEVRKEVEAGCQTIQYQEITLSSTNGQAPFITIFMYLDEVPDGQARKDLALVIETMLRQRIKGVKNRSGHYITPAFPKLIYVLDEDNIHDDSEYFYLTKLAAECTAKRMVPDYISAKIMKELKGDVYPCMGCVDGSETIAYTLYGKKFVESFEQAWNRLTECYPVKEQTPGSPHLYMDTPDVMIYDTTKGYVKCRRFIRNLQRKWMTVWFSTNRKINVTDDHPFETENRGVVLARDLRTGDSVLIGNASLGEVPSTTEKQLLGVARVVSTVPYEIEKFSYDVTTESEHFEVSGIYSHNCRSFLTPDRFSENGWDNKEHAMNNVEGKHKYYGRFNQGVVTLNLVDVACSSGKDMNKFWEIMKDRLALCHRALRLRHDSLLGTPSDVAPILWQDGAYARLEPGEKIDKLLYGGYSTISLGYAGLAECVRYMLGVSHTSEEGKEFGLKVMQAMNDACNQWKADENIDYSVYGTPLESTTYKFAKCLQKRFGKIEDVTDHDYITNSYHICVREEIDAFSKLTKEAQFQKLSPGGAISYVEVPNMQNNIPAVIAVMRHIYKTILYAELNTKSDYCDACGYDGEIVIKEDENKHLYWQCPNCGNTDQTKMHVARRTCGYIGTQYWNRGRTACIRDRKMHL